MPGGPSPARDPYDDAAIEPANGAPKKGLAYRRAPAGLGRLRREPDPCVRRRSGAMARSARGCMGPAEFGNAGLPREKRLAGRRESAVGSDAPSSLAISEAPSPSARRRLIYEMADMPTISLPAPPRSIAEATAKIGQSRGMVGAFAYAAKEAP